jgi:hypothetical protein
VTSSPALADMYRKYGPLVKETVGGKTILHVFDLGKSILSSSKTVRILIQ